MISVVTGGQLVEVDEVAHLFQGTHKPQASSGQQTRESIQSLLLVLPCKLGTTMMALGL